MVMQLKLDCFQEYEADTNEDILDILLGAAPIYDNDPTPGYRILEVTADGVVDNRFTIRTIPA